MKLSLGSKHENYFVQEKYKSLITMRGFIGHKIALGRPKNRIGVLLVIVLLALIAIESLIVLLLPF